MNKRASLILIETGGFHHSFLRDLDKFMIGSCATVHCEGSSMTFAEFWPVYVRAHSRPGTRVAHLVGTLGGWMLVGAAIAERRWWWVAAVLCLPTDWLGLRIFSWSTTCPRPLSIRCSPGGRISAW